MRKLLMIGLTGACAAVLFASNVHAALPAPKVLYNSQGVAADAWTVETKLRDLSGNGYDAVIGVAYSNTAVKLQGPKMRKVFDTTGLGATYIHRPTTDFPSFTVSAMFCRTGNGSYNGVANCLFSNVNGIRLESEFASTEWNLKVGGKETGLKASVPRNRWHLLTVTYDQGVASLYFDDVPVGSAEVAAPALTGEMFIGNEGTMNKHSLCGRIDEVRIYDAALDAEQVKELYSDMCPLLLDCRWTMDEVAADAAGRRVVRNQREGGPDLVLGDWVTPTNGVIDGALFFGGGVFDGQTPCSNVSAIASGSFADRRGDFTMMMWYRRSTGQQVGNNARLMSIYNGCDIQVPNSGTSVNISELGGWQEDAWTASPGIASDEVWVHLAWTLEFKREFADGNVVTKRRTLTYRNGELVKEREWVDDAVKNRYDNFFSSDRRVAFGNYCDTLTRPSRATMDDIRIYRGKMTAEKVREIARGPAKVFAGTDFAVRAARARLNGRVSPYAVNAMAQGFAGRQTWSLVSAPNGGESARIETPECESTDVSLPVEGTYVFRFSSSAGDIVVSDDVSVTREAAAADANAVPTATASVDGLAGRLAVAQAVADDVDGDELRFRWTVLSGPGAASFADATAANTLVRFTAAGTYVLRCEVDDGTDVASADVSVTVESAVSLADQLADALHCYLPMDLRNDATGVAYCVPYDEVNKVFFSANSQTFANGGRPYNGVAGSQSLGLTDGLKDGNADYFSNSSVLYSAKNAGDNSPAEDWHTLSCWIRHESGRSLKSPAAVLMAAAYMKTFFYLPNLDGKPAIRILQHTPGSTPYTSDFPVTGVEFTNNWVHVVIQANQRGTEDHEVWVNGVRQTASTLARQKGRYYADRPILVGGGGYVQQTDVDPDLVDGRFGYPFPGQLAEYRWYWRHLSAAEIRYLHEFPTAEKAEFGATIAIAESDLHFEADQRKKPQTLPVTVSAANGGELDVCWKVIGGDAAKVAFSDEHAITPTVTFAAHGEFVLQVSVREGMRTVCSRPIRARVDPFGIVLIVR